MLTNSNLIQLEDTVIILEDRKPKLMLTLKDGQTFQNKSGAFHHVSFIGKPYGGKFWSKNGQGFIHILKPTPYLITETVAHKTQILFQMDISMILLMLDVRSGKRVVESGTGSGSLSSSLAQALTPAGHLFSYEFNQDRADNGQQLMKKLISQFIDIKEFDQVATVFWRDVYGDGFVRIENDNEFNNNKEFPQESSIDSIFLDLPQPWSAFEHSKRVITKGGRLCTFSPCIEQVQKSCIKLKEDGWKAIETIECLKRQFERRVKTETNLFSKRKLELTETDPLDGEEKHLKTDNQGVHRIENTKKVFYSAGVPKAYGHTGYLTFAIMI